MYFYIHDIIEHHLFVQIGYTSSDIQCNRISLVLKPIYSNVILFSARNNHLHIA